MKTSILCLLSLPALVLGSCTSSSESAHRDEMTRTVGVYEPPPYGVQHARVGVPAFEKSEKMTAGMNEQAADQLVSLCANADRFDVIERNKLDQLLKEQSLEGIVKGGELAAPAQVRGVDWLLLGKVTNFRVKAEATGKNFNLGSLPVPGTRGALGLFDINDKNSQIQVDCGVDLRLVDPSTGAIVVANFAEYQRVDSIGAMGVSILGSNAQANADLKVDQDSQGKILRLALDECLRKMMPKVDKALQARSKASAPQEPAKPEAAKQDAGKQEPKAGGAATPTFCSSCGKALEPDAKFCPVCGHKVN